MISRVIGHTLHHTLMVTMHLQMKLIPIWSPGQENRRFLPWLENHCQVCPSKPVTAGQRKPIIIHRPSIQSFRTVSNVAAHWAPSYTTSRRRLIRSDVIARLKGPSKCCLKGGIQTALSFWRFNVVGWLLELQQHGHLGNKQRQVKSPPLRMKYLVANKGEIISK